jgi:hypothetical protein
MSVDQLNEALQSLDDAYGSVFYLRSDHSRDRNFFALKPAHDRYGGLNDDELRNLVSGLLFELETQGVASHRISRDDFEEIAGRLENAGLTSKSTTPPRGALEPFADVMLKQWQECMERVRAGIEGTVRLDLGIGDDEQRPPV